MSPEVSIIADMRREQGYRLRVALINAKGEREVVSKWRHYDTLPEAQAKANEHVRKLYRQGRIGPAAEQAAA